MGHKGLSGIRDRAAAVRSWAGVAARTLCCWAVLFACSAAWAAEPKRVLLLHSFGRDFKPWSDYATFIRQELDRQSPWPIDINEHSLVTARFSDQDPEGAFVEYLRALFAKPPLDLIISIGAPAAGFVQRHRQQLFADTPMVLTAIDHRRVQNTTLTPNDAVVAVNIDYLAAVENILQVLPDTRNVTVVVGTSPIEKFWREAIAKQVEPLANRVKFSWTDHLPFNDFLKQAATLPPHSAIFWELMIVDAAGVVYEGSTPLARLHAVANAPIFSYDESFFGREIVGGPLLRVADSSRQTATVGIRILAGEKAGDIKVPLVQFAGPMYDWRELTRWGISESRLPPGSEIHFREPTAWERYRAQILLVCAALLLQASLISWLVYEHWRRHAAELAARNTMAELMQMNRLAGAGELSASIAHEVNQPLTAIAANSGAILALLRAPTPNMDEVRHAADSISDESHRAGDIVKNLRAMFRKDIRDNAPVDINRLIAAVLDLMRAELQRHQISVRTELRHGLPPVLGDEVQLQQVLLNLIMNAKEAMQAADFPRTLRITSEFNEPDLVQVSVEDSGPGLSASEIDRLFTPMFTTKAGGMGMGLSICRRIVETHGGRIWVAGSSTAGLLFCFTLPAALEAS